MHIESYIEYLQYEKNYSSHTISAYKKDLSLFLLFVQEQGVVSVVDVAYSDIRGWVTDLLENGDTHRTVNRKMSSIKSYFKFLLKIGELTIDPSSLYKSLKVAKKIQVPFSTSEVLKLLDSNYDENDFEQSRDFLMIELLYATGIRRDELINLKIPDVDLIRGQIKVTGKRDKQRIIPLVHSIKNHLQKYLGLRSVVAVSSVHELFVTSKGIKVYPSLVYRVIKSYFSKVSVKVKISPHVLRHTFATHLLDHGADLNAVKELLGHTSLSSTQIYTHSSMATLKGVYGNAHPRSKK
ncbi:tyrosine-type recombinase/integrase [Nonlabens sp.]|uniref:tyrosine-type recombinase/integrase n=1 Tax=Nonlabens sp. TaxID=1888209 RepID=UPI003265DBB7